MELNEFIDGFREQFDETDASDIQLYTHFQELDEWSSLSAMSIIAFVKINYNKEITGKEIRSCETVEDLFKLVQSK
jgi:acyl carrier protein